ncbi:TetR/AcrR family transcriptional regulator [Pseudonocardia sp. TRM90224]|uniref:TetR/AcrR family transcriptional regulator n=1 Tax=Pseudonocardia sp. TRM90224 TaxID=2812678 RepID=UPI001E294A0B|nr:TetR/AcrR family transcriptional regulator [Pseudonocardia sp. TRM90224]
MTAAQARRPGGRSARVREAVRAAVLGELAEHGFDVLTVDAVAARSGVHRTTIYRRWTDVGGLLADALDASGGDGWEPPDTGSLAGDLVELNRQVHAALVEEPSVAGAVIAASFRSEQAAGALRAFWADRYARCAVVVERAVGRGELAAGTAPMPVLIAATAPLFHHHMLLGTPLTGDQVDAYALAASYSSRQAVR